MEFSVHHSLKFSKMWLSEKEAEDLVVWSNGVRAVPQRPVGLEGNAKADEMAKE